jgi:tRNA 2-thiouridine synthesizing protein A
MSRILDTRGLSCPLPVLKARKVLGTMRAEEELTLLATDPASAIDVRHFCHETGHRLVHWNEQDGVFTYRIRHA